MTNNDKWDSEWPATEKAIQNLITNTMNHKPIPNIPWPSDPFAWPEGSAGLNNNWLTHTSDVANSPQSGIVGWPKDEDQIEVNIIKKFKSQGSNLVDDQQYLYFHCESCNEVLDPHTKSFQKLQEHRVNAGWKCVWNLNGQGYKVYCKKCGDKT